MKNAKTLLSLIVVLIFMMIVHSCGFAALYNESEETSSNAIQINSGVVSMNNNSEPQNSGYITLNPKENDLIEAETMFRETMQEIKKHEAEKLTVKFLDVYTNDEVSYSTENSDLICKWIDLISKFDLSFEAYSPVDGGSYHFITIEAGGEEYKIGNGLNYGYIYPSYPNPTTMAKINNFNELRYELFNLEEEMGIPEKNRC